MLHTEPTAPQPTAKELYKQFNILTGVLTTLMQRGEQILTMAEEHPDSEPVEHLLGTLRTELTEARLEMDKTMAAIDHLWQGKRTS